MTSTSQTGTSKNIGHFYHELQGWFWFQSAYEFLLGQLPVGQRAVWVEIGVYHGRSLAWVGVEALRQGKPLEIHAVDIEMQPGHQETVKRLLEAGATVKSWIGDSAVVGDAFEKQADVVWVDGDHSEDGCFRDIVAWWPKVKPGGYIGGDDYEMGGVEKAVTRAFGADVQLGYGLVTDGPAPRPYPYWLVRKPL